MKPQIHTFKNGLRLVVVPQPQAATVTAVVLVGTGSLYESDKERGLSHFLEHMLFKGTTKRPSARIISEELDAIGAVSNAFTMHEYTGYYAKGSPKHIDTFIHALSDIYIHSTFPEVEIEKEKGVIVEEINMYEDMLPHKALEALMVAMYGDTPAGRSILGTAESVRSFTREDFLKYTAKHYHGANTVVVVSGAIEMKTIRPLVQKAFEGIATKKVSTRAKTRIDMARAPTIVSVKPSDQMHIAIGFHSLPFRHKDAVVVSLIATILGRGMSSRLFLKLREELGVAYYVSAEHESLKDYGIFGIAAGIDKTRLDEVLGHIAEDLSDMKTTLVAPAELSKAKEYTLGMMRLGLESSDDIAMWYGVPLVMGKDAKTPAEIAKEYMAVTAQDIKRVAKKIFDKKGVYMSVVGAVDSKNVPNFRNFL